MSINIYLNTNMKYCDRRNYEYKGLNGNETSTNYVTFNDIKQFHGEEFANQWLEFAKHGGLKESVFGTDQGYYYIDYQFYSQRTKTFLEST